MEPIEVTQANFEQVAGRDGVVVLDWWAPWCAPCRGFAPVFERAARKHPDLTFGKVNTDAEQALAAAFQIRSIPTLMIMRDRVLLFAQPGSLPEDALEHLIAQARTIDMDAVRAEAEAAETPATDGE